jgi:2-hydroxy-3-oxopropionate reductase
MERIGFIGLGAMGKPMARNLLAAGYPLVVASRSPAPVRELEGEGASPADTPREVAERSDVVITMLPDTPDVESVVTGEDGVLEGLGVGSLVIDMSTITPSAARRLAEALAERGAEGLDAPVSGGDIGAREGALSIMVGGSEAAFARAAPIFDVVGGNVIHIGPAGAGQVAKACNQIVVAVTLQAVAEALLLAAKSGVDARRVREALLGGFAGSRILEVHGLRMLDRDFEPGFKTSLQLKDLSIVLSEARQLGLGLPATAIAEQLFAVLDGQGAGDRDNSSVVTVLEQWAGIQVGGPAGTP